MADVDDKKMQRLASEEMSIHKELELENADCPAGRKGSQEVIGKLLATRA